MSYTREPRVIASVRYKDQKYTEDTGVARRATTAWLAHHCHFLEQCKRLGPGISVDSCMVCHRGGAKCVAMHKFPEICQIRQ